MTAKLKLLKFTADWCPPCKAMKPVLKKFCAAHPEVAFTEVDCDDPEGFTVSKTMNIQALPTMLFVDAADARKRPAALAKMVGSGPLDVVEAAWAKAVRAARRKVAAARAKKAAGAR